MDPQYQQMMVQQLMGAGTQAPGMGGQNASTPYGAAFMTGNSAMPSYMNGSTGSPQARAQQSPYGMLNQSAPQVLQQPMATY